MALLHSRAKDPLKESIMSNIVPFQFQDHSITVLMDDNGEPWFVAKEVADVLGYSDAYEITKRLDDDEKSNRQIAGLGSPTGGRGVAIINESGLYSAVLGSTKPEAKPFKRWVTHDVLPSIRKTGSYTAPKASSAPRAKGGITRTQASIAEMLIKSAAEHLKLAPSAVLGCYQRLESMAGVPGLLPAYSVDAPVSAAGSGSSEETKSAAELLELHGVGLSSIAFNRLLLEHGFLEERERPSSKGGTKKFKVCTDPEYGKNLTSPNNPRETQPHWYVRKFAELLDLVLPAKPMMVTA